jgi:hypothetical protein
MTASPTNTAHISTIAPSAALSAQAQANFEQRLRANPYPGRGIVIGASPSGQELLQVYWIMGRSSNSRNRIFVANADGSMQTQAWDASKLEDPSLIIYHPIRNVGPQHIVTNGDQTDTIADFLKCGNTFEAALATREFEPDPPNLTPRISGYCDLASPGSYALSILKSQANDATLGCLRQVFRYQRALQGLGHGITTYMGDGNPLPSFAGEPMVLPLLEGIEANADLYWKALNEENRVSLVVKRISLRDGSAELRIINRHS